MRIVLMPLDSLMNSDPRRQRLMSIFLAMLLLFSSSSNCIAHGTVVFPASRVYRVYQHLNGQGPAFPLAANAIQIDGSLSYYTWNELSRNTPQAVTSGLPQGFDYSPWMPNTQIASAGRTNPNATEYPRTYAGLDQVSASWPKTAVSAGSTITVQFLATAPHSPSVWDVWMTKPTWNPSMPLTWNEMQFLVRPNVTSTASGYSFNLTIPSDRSGHHVLWVAWQRNDPAGEVFISTSDLDIQGGFNLSMLTSGGGIGDLFAQISGLPQGTSAGFTLLSFNTAGVVGQGSLFGINPDLLTFNVLTSPPAPTNPLHFVAPFVPGFYPVAPINVPAGAFAPFAGMAMDAQVIALNAGFNLLGMTNVSRVMF